MSNALRNRRGYTLWEMALVMAILAVLTALAVPAYIQLGAERPRTGTEQFVDLVNDSRRLATRHNVLAMLVIDPLSGHYRLDSLGASGLGTVVDDTLDLGASASFETTLPRLRYLFRPTGAAFGDSVVIHGTDSTRVVHVDRWSGVAHARSR